MASSINDRTTWPALPSILPHIVAPVLFALAFMPMQRKRILLWSPIVLAPDLDYFFARSFHRAALSNIWIPLILIGVLVVLWRRRDAAAAFWEWAFRPGAPGNLLLVNYYLIAHIVMDFFVGGVSLLWPLTNRNFYFIFQIVVDTATNKPVTTTEGGTDPDIVSVSPAFEWWSVIDTAVAAFLVVATLAYLAYRRWYRARHPLPLVIKRGAIAAPIHKE